jgi:anaerobic magnesium-protoporphyrin IX monomethyl ester cyclase
MAVETYFEMGNKFGVLQRRSRSLPIIASRGCPSDCTFCLRFLGRRFRVRSAENIVGELTWLKQRFGVTEFNFLDDNFTLHKIRVMEVCDLIHKRDLKITFRFPNGVREDFLDEDIMNALKSVGCYHLDFGIESGSQRVLDLMKKGKKVEEIAEKVHLSKKHGFKISASFLFGTPGETIEEMEETIRFAAALPLDSASFGIVTPFPGTELRKEAMEKGFLVHSDYEYYNIGLVNSRPPIVTPQWSAEELLSMIKKANRAFFFRPGRMVRLLPTMLNPTSFKRYVSSLYQVLRG